MRRYWLLYFVTLGACIDPLEVRLTPAEPALVVDGLISDQPGPYTVKLFYASRLDTTSIKMVRYVHGASVWIEDSEGSAEKLTETSTGIYQTSATGLRGQIGQTYHLRIVTPQKFEYQSKPQTMQAAGTIDRLYPEYQQGGLLVGNLRPVDSFSIFIDAHGSESDSKLYRWRWTNTYKGETFPMLRKKYTVGGPVPDPEPCSGYIANGLQISKVGDCTCCICWTTETNTTALVSDSRYSADQTFKHFELSKLQLTAMRFYEKYYSEVEQLSVSADEYQFWKLAQAQQRGTGSLFQPNSFTVRGNVTCITDPSREALGIFSVSAITSKVLIINKADVGLPLPRLDTIQYNCMEGMQGGGTTTKPDFW